MAGFLDNLDPTSAFLLAAGSGLMGTRGPGGFGRAGLMGLDAMQAAKRMRLLEEESRRRDEEMQAAAEFRKLQARQVEAQLADAERQRAARDAWKAKITGGAQARQAAAEEAGTPPSLGPIDPQADVANIIRNANVMNSRAQAAQQAGALPYTYDEAVEAELNGVDPKARERLVEMMRGIEMKPGTGYRNPRTGQMEFTPDPKEGYQVSNGRVVEMPGAVDLAARRAGAIAEAQAAAGAGYDFLEQLDKRPGSPTFGQIINVPKRSMAGAGPPQAAAPEMRVTPAAQYGRDQERLRLLEAERAAAKNPADIAALDREIASTRARLRQLGTAPPAGPAAPPAAPAQPGALVSPKQAEVDAQQRGTEARITATRNSMLNIGAALGTAFGKLGFMSTGLVGQIMQNVGGTDAKSLREAAETLKANLSADNLQQIRDFSATGAGVGNVALGELELLGKKVASLDITQDEATLRRNLITVQRHYENYMKAMDEAYRAKFGRAFIEPGGSWGAPTPAADVPIDDLVKSILSRQ